MTASGIGRAIYEPLSTRQEIDFAVSRRRQWAYRKQHRAGKKAKMLLIALLLAPPTGAAPRRRRTSHEVTECSARLNLATIADALRCAPPMTFLDKTAAVISHFAGARTPCSARATQDMIIRPRF